MGKAEPNTWAVVVAAGGSTRMGDALCGTNKVLSKAGSTSQPFLFYTLSALRDSRVFAGIVLVARPEDTAEVSKIAKTTLEEIPYLITPGGATRQESVLSGLSSLPDSCDFVAVHDAARPFCPIGDIVAVCQKAYESQAAILAIQAKSTLKVVKDNSSIEKTIHRSLVWEAQTPQVFDRQTLLRAHRQALSEDYSATDDSEVVERLGIPVYIVKGSEANIKLTTEQDLIFASFLLSNK